jgi:hypothetical protein
VSASPFASVELMQQHCQKTMGEIRPTFALFSSDQLSTAISHWRVRLSTIDTFDPFDSACVEPSQENHDSVPFSSVSTLVCDLPLRDRGC